MVRTKTLNTVLLGILAGILLFIFGLIVLHAPLIVSLGRLWPDLALPIKAWKELLMLVALLIVVVLVTRKKMWRELLGDRLIQLSAAYGLVHVLMLPIFWQGVQASAAGLMIDLRYVLFFVLVYVTLKMAPQYKRLFVKVGVIGAAIVVGFALLQVFVLPKDFLTVLGYSRDTIAPFLTVDQNHDFIRISSTLRGPNPLGAYALIVLSLAAALLVRRKVTGSTRSYVWFALLAAGSVVALWASYSRSAVIGVVVAVIFVVASGLARKIILRYGLVFAGLAVIFAALLFVFKDSSFVANVILHDNPTTGAGVNSNEGHAESLKDGAGRLLVQPLGGGVGSTGSPSLFTEKPLIIENQYLYIAHEAGWLGLVYFMGLFSLILYRLWHKRTDWLALGALGSGIGLALIGLLQPVWADDTISLVWWGLAAVALAGTINKKGTNNVSRKTSPSQ